MKRLFAFIVVVLGISGYAHAENPPYTTADPAVMEDMRIIYDRMEQHQHTGTDGTSVLVSSSLPNSGVTAGTYSNANITVNVKGIVTSAASGSGGASTTTIVRDFVAGIPGNNLIASTASFIDIMGCYIIDYSTQANITLVGQGGLDTGSEAANTSYSVYAISDSACTASGILLSASNTHTPTAMPTGYTKWRKIGNVRNDGSSNFLVYSKNGLHYTYSAQQFILSSASPAGATTAIDGSALISTSSVSCVFEIIAVNSIPASQFVSLKPLEKSNENETGTRVQLSSRFDLHVPLALGLRPKHQILEYKASGIDTLLDIDVLSCEEDVP